MKPAPDGWERRFAASGERLEEMVALYESMGLEIRLEPAGGSAEAAFCEGCAAGAEESFTIYTRRPAAISGTGGAR